MMRASQRPPAALIALMETSHDCVKLIARDGTVRYLNAQGCSLLELESPSVLLGRPWIDVWPETVQAAVKTALEAAWAGSPTRFSAVCPTAQGNLRHWDVALTPLPEEDGEAGMLLVFSRDVTELVEGRLKADERERALERQTAALRSAGRVAKIGGWEIDFASSEVHWSEEAWELLRGKPSRITLADAMEIYDPSDRGRILGLFDHARASGERITFEADITRFDGTRGAVRVFGEPVFDAGACVALRGAAQDITEVRQARESLEGAERRLRLAVEMSHILVYEVDFQRREVFSEGAEHLFFERGLTYEEMWRDPFASIHPSDQRAVRRRWAAAEKAGEDFRGEYRVARTDGHVVWAHSTFQLRRDARGRPLRLVGALQDITAHKRAEQDLIAARDQANAANAAKTAFLANVSHEIRTPLNGILGMAQVLARSELPDAAKSQLDIIRQSGESLMATLNDVLDLSKIEAGRLELEHVAFDLRDCIETACRPFALQAEQKDLAFAVHVPPHVGPVLGDPLRLRQVVTNLIANALKFTEVGEIEIELGFEDGRLRLAVRDTGIGMNEDQQAAVFAKFVQGDTSTTRRYGGTGLGLAICREIVELMNGRIWVESQPGVGTTFFVEAPLHEMREDRGTPRASTAPARVGARRVRILAADDNRTNRLVLQALLEPAGVELVQVEDGERAVALAAEGGFDLILMDIQMPALSGLDAAAAIRGLEARRGGPRTPILALTANVMSHQVAEYERAGMDGCIAKPLQAERLYAAIEAALEGRAATGRSGSDLDRAAAR
jgi:PAS domain S-box-containing protein